MTGELWSSLEATGRAILRVQLDDGCIPWFEGGHADPWDHVEAAMALDVSGYHDAAAAAYRWLCSTQRPDGAWPAAIENGAVVDPTLDANFCAYIATGCWHHYAVTGDGDLIEQAWPAVARAVDFALGLQLPSGAIGWARDAAGQPWPGALLTSSSSIYHSIGCALALARTVGEDRLDWELALTSLGRAIAGEDPGAFEPKDRFSMDWYYPVLCGAVTGAAALRRIEERWDEFVVDGYGARCVNDRPWVTTGETAELILALDRIGLEDRALEMFGWIQKLRSDDGSFWTGMTVPEETVWPRERPTWGSGAVLLAADALWDLTPASGLFRGETLPAAAVRTPEPVDVTDSMRKV